MPIRREGPWSRDDELGGYARTVTLEAPPQEAKRMQSRWDELMEKAERETAGTQSAGDADIVFVGVGM